MQNLLANPTNSDKLSIILFILSVIIAVGIAYIFYLLSIQAFNLKCYSKANRIIGTNDEKMSSYIKIIFNDNIIPRLTRVVYAVWNDGNKVINRSDVAQKDQLRFIVDSDDKILSCKILRYTKEINEISVDIDDKNPICATIDFDHLARGDGFVIEILHTADRKYLPLQGTIKGMKSIKYTNGVISKDAPESKIKATKPNSSSIYSLIYNPSQSNRRKVSYIVTVVGIIGMVFGFGAIYFPNLFSFLADKNTHPLGPKELGPIIIGASSVYTITGFAAMWTARRAYPKALQCEELE